GFVTDQIEVLYSRRLMRKVVDQHHLNIIYAIKGKIRSSEILEKNMPFIVQPQGDQDTTFINIRVRPINKNQLHVTDLVTSEKIDVLFGKKVLIGNNQLVFQKNPANPLEINGVEYLINVVPKDWAIDANLTSISITPSKEMQSYVVNFSMEST